MPGAEGDMHILSEWISLGVSERIAKVLPSLGLKRPTITQRAAIPKIVGSDRDVLLVAPTGTGKTEAVLIPLLQKCMNNAEPVSILYVTPLRALNRDISARISRIASIIGFSVAVWHGDTTQSQRRRIVSNPPHVLVTTPESLQIVLLHRGLREYLRNCSFVVVDEAQELYTSKRGLELVVALNRLDVLARRHVRRIALSAPVGKAEAIAEFFFYPRPFEIIDVKHAKSYEIEVDTLGPRTNVSSFAEALYVVPRMLEVLRERRSGQILIFVNTRVAAEELGYLLRNALGSVGVHHGSLSREVRESIEFSLKRGDLRVVIATSSLELGIDVGGVDLVVQVMSPRQAARLVQRVGRAGHREGLVSRGIVLVPPMLLELLEAGVITRKVMNYEIEDLPTYSSALDVALHQLIGIALEWKRPKVEHIHKILVNTKPFSNLDMEDLEKVIGFAKDLRLINIREDGAVEVTKRGELYYKTTTMIVDTAKYRAKDVLTLKTIATLDEEFVVTCNEGDVVVLGGKLWKIVSVNDESREVLLEPVTRTEALKLPRWVGENIPVSTEVAEEVCRTIEDLCSCTDDSQVDEVLRSLNLSENAIELVKEYLAELCRIRPSLSSVVIEVSTSKTFPYIAVYSCLGTRGSEALALLLSAVVEELVGIRTSYRAHQVCTLIALPRPIDRAELRRVLEYLKKLDLEHAIHIVKRFVTSTPLFDWFVIKVAKKMGLVSHRVSLGEAKRVLPGLKQIDIVREEAFRELEVEKLDFKALEKFLNKLKSPGTRIIVYLVREPSKLVKEVASLTPLSLNVAPPLPRTSLTNIMLRRLSNNIVHLQCLSCCYRWSTNLKSVIESFVNDNASTDLEMLRRIEIKCPRCQSKALTMVRDDEESNRLRRVIKLLQRHGLSKLSSDDKAFLDKHRKIASLVMDYGVLALIVLQAVGIGPENAKRILSRARDVNELIDLVIQCQRNYLLTRRFWRK